MYNETTIIEEQIMPGMRMYQAQEIIHAGRVAIKELLTHEPIDHDSISVQRQGINDARKEVTKLTSQLRRKREQQVSLSRGWIIRY
jgi:hypothetical protein